MNETFCAAADFLRPFLYKIAMTITAAPLVLFGSHMNGLIRDIIKKYNFFIRLVVFILVVTFGYGALTLLLTQGVAHILGRLPRPYLCPSLALIFIAIGIIAEEKKHI